MPCLLNLFLSSSSRNSTTFLFVLSYHSPSLSISTSRIYGTMNPFKIFVTAITFILAFLSLGAQTGGFAESCHDGQILPEMSLSFWCMAFDGLYHYSRLRLSECMMNWEGHLKVSVFFCFSSPLKNEVTSFALASSSTREVFAFNFGSLAQSVGYLNTFRPFSILSPLFLQ